MVLPVNWSPSRAMIYPELTRAVGDLYLVDLSYRHLNGRDQHTRRISDHCSLGYPAPHIQNRPSPVPNGVRGLMPWMFRPRDPVQAP